MQAPATRHDVYAGAIFIGLGAYFAIEALNYERGTLVRMGPGYAPLILGTVLVVLGVAIAANGFLKTRAVTGENPSWRAIGVILATIAFFGLCIRGLGFVPTVFVGALITAFASRMTSILGAFLIAAGITLLSTVVFVIGLGMPIARFGPWLAFLGIAS